MKKLLFVLGGAVILASCQQQQKKEVKLATVEDSLSYGIGVSIGTNVNRDFSRQSLDTVINVEAFLNGIRDVMDSAELKMDEASSQAVIQDYFQGLQTRQTAAKKEKHSATIQEGEQFLAENVQKEGVKVTASGLQYKVLKEGNGPKPGPADVVKVHYHGTFLNGEVFDSSVERGEPATFPVNRVIPGWTEALQMMPVGSKWKVWIPYDLAYGEGGGPGGQIPPFSTLVFEVELLGIEEQQQGAQPR